MTTRAGISGRFRSLLGFALLLLMVCSTSTWAQEAATAAAITQSPAVDDCLHRSIPLTVLMKPDNLELQSIHLAIRSGDTNASVLSLQKEKISPRVILLLDASGSMAGTLNWKWKNALLAGAFALDAIPSQSQVALVTFNREIHISGFKDRLAVNQELLALRNTKPVGRQRSMTPSNVRYSCLGRRSSATAFSLFLTVPIIMAQGSPNPCRRN